MCQRLYYDRKHNEYYTNIYSVDVKGTGAGGAYTTVGDIEKFWDALLQHKLLSAEMTSKMLSRQSGCEKDGYYGYGIWLKKGEKNCYTPYFQGCDPGVSFISTYQAKEESLITIISNFGNNVWRMMKNANQDLFSV